MKGARFRLFIGTSAAAVPKNRTMIGSHGFFLHDFQKYAQYAVQQNRDSRMWFAPVTDPRKLRLPGSV